MVAFLDSLRERLFGQSFLYQFRNNPISNIIDLAPEFCNDPNGDEWHSIWLGFFTPLERAKLDAEIIASYPAPVQEFVYREWWYFKGGQFAGRLFLLVLGAYVATNTIIPVVF